MAALTELIEREQRLIEDLRHQAREIEARGGSGDKEDAEAMLLKISALQAKVDALAARQVEPARYGLGLRARIARMFGLD
jgi:hypothetical protein